MKAEEFKKEREQIGVNPLFRITRFDIQRHRITLEETQYEKHLRFAKESGIIKEELPTILDRVTPVTYHIMQYKSKFLYEDAFKKWEENDNS